MSWKTQNSASMMTTNTLPNTFAEYLTKSNKLPSKTCVIHHGIALDQGNKWWRRAFVDIHFPAVVIENHHFLHPVTSSLTLQPLSLIAGFTVTLQAILCDQAGCFSAVLRIIMLALFQAELTLSLLLHFEQIFFCDCCFDAVLILNLLEQLWSC